LWGTLKTLKKDNDIIGLLSFWCGECAFIGKWFGKRNNLRHLTWITGQDARKGNRYISLIRPQPNELIAMSDFLSDEFYKNYAVRPLHVISNGIDVSLFSKQNSERNVTILGVGSLISLKHYDVFVNVLKKIVERIPVTTAMLCGKGPEEMELQKLIAQLMLQNKIILTGEISHQKILQLMQRAKIFLHTSNYEGFSTVCLEALYAGCDVISFVRPMHDDIDHWHIVNTEEEMVKKAIELLVSGRDNTPVLPYVMGDSAKAIMQLFNYKEAATS
jgi:glycosyltransferase involved in cell wall biosynthesis